MFSRALAAATLALLLVACGGSTNGGFADGGSDGSLGGSGGAGGAGAVGGTGGVGAAGGVGGAAGSVGCTAPSPATLSGTFFLAASATISPTKPIVFLATFEWPNASTLQMRLVPLASSDRKTPVGVDSVLSPIPVASDGTLATGTYPISVPAEANPITGTEIELSAGFNGALCGGHDFYCGDLHGEVTKPLTLDLAGSSYTLQRVTDPSTYPEPPYINCAQALAEPLAP